MLGIHVSEGTAEGWFGQGKTSAIASVVIVAVLLIALIALGIFIINQPAAPWVPATPAAPATPAPTQPSPTITNEIVPSGVVVLTVEELVNQIIQNPNKYKKGVVIQVTGTTFPPPIGSNVYNLYLRSKVQDWHVVITTDIAGNLANYMIKNHSNIQKGIPITIQGTLDFVAPEGKYILLDNGILVTNTK